MKFFLLVLVLCFAAAYGVELFDNTVIAWENISLSLDGFLSSEWLGLTPHAALEYYTMNEICEFTNGIGNPACHKFSGDIGSCKVSGRGMGHVQQYCSNPLGAFLKHKSIKSWPESESLLDVIRRMKVDGSNTLVLVGDSLTGQHVADAYCSLTRYGAQLRALDQRFLPMVDIFDRYEDCFEVVDPEKKESSLPYFNVVFLREPVIDDGSGYVPWLKNSTNAIANFPLVTGKVTFIYNIGLHVHSADQYENLLNVSMPVLLQLAKEGHTIVFRETSAQHFPTETGEYHHRTPLPKVPADQRNNASPVSLYFNRLNPLIVDSTNTSFKQLVDFRALNHTKYTSHRCFAIKNETALDAQNWRNKLVYKYLAEHDPKMQYVGVAPHYRATAARHDSHLYSTPEDDDCSHYCFFPTLWAPVWDYVAKYYASHHNGMKIEALSDEERNRTCISSL